MIQQLMQLGLVLMISLFLAGCPSKDGSSETADPELFFPDPVPEGLPEYKNVVEPLFGDVEQEVGESLVSARSLLSFDPADPAADLETIIFNTPSDLSVALNTVDDDLMRDEFTVFSSQDTVYKVTHETGEIRLLARFTNRVCEIIPVEVVDTSTSNGVNDVQHTVLHGEWVYIVTSTGDGSSDDCVNIDNMRRYYELSLNYQFNAPEDDEVLTSDLPSVSESLARSQLVFGWVDDEVTTGDLTDKRLDYGYLGYGFLEQEDGLPAGWLRFFDSSRQEVWSQHRVAEEFDVEQLATGEYSDRYLFELYALDQTNYVLQIGRDVFVFDASEMLFARDFDDVDDLLEDRSFRLEATADGHIQGLDYVADDQELIILDAGKFYRYDYLAAFTSPNVSRNFSVKQMNAVSISDISYGDRLPFSQFDLLACDSDEVASQADCEFANNPDPITNPTWQFITDCSLAFDCSFEVVADGVCATDAELIIDPDAGERCTASNYLHLADLDTTGNDAEFRGYMQFTDYIRSTSLVMNQSRLYVTARMNLREVLVSYDYNQSLVAPKVDRETVIFGERLDHQGLDVYFQDDNLYVTSLLPGLLRTNECYKNYQLVQCNLGELDSNGLASNCTGKDLSEGLCFNEFREYSSTALFCAADEITDGTCSDNSVMPINDLKVELDGQSGRWLSIYQIADDLWDLHLLSASDADVQDEGVLIAPSLYEHDYVADVNQISFMGQVPSSVESVSLDNFISSDGVSRLSLIEAEVEQTGSGSIEGAESIFGAYFLGGDLTEIVNPSTSNLVRPYERF